MHLLFSFFGPTLYSRLQEADSLYKLDPIDFGRRMAVEKALDASKNAPPSNVIFDQTSNFILYPTMAGIKGDLFLPRHM